MACISSCIMYPILFLIIILGILLKLYFFLTTGRYKIERSLKGKVVVITGGSAGIGKETVRELAKHEATIHMLARDLPKAERVIEEIKIETGNEDIHLHYANLSDFSTIREFAKKFINAGWPIHILINNAGLVNMIKRVTIDGNEETTQVNHLGHFLLTNLLLDRIKESSPSRIVNVSSLAHTFVKSNTFDAHDLNFQKQSNPWDAFKAYNWSKLMNILFTRELAHRLKGKGVTVNALHPGAVRTELVRSKTWTSPVFWALKLAGPFMKSSLEGAQTTLYVAASDALKNVNGHYFSDCKPTATTVQAIDDTLATELWIESQKLTGMIEN